MVLLLLIVAVIPAWSAPDFRLLRAGGKDADIRRSQARALRRHEHGRRVRAEA